MHYFFRIAISFLLPRFIESHACLSKPASRQWYAYTEGKSAGQGDEARGLPEKEFSPFGFQAGGYDFGPCGRRRADDLEDDYTTNYVDPFGDPVTWKNQATYIAGEEIEIEVTVTANHRGFFEFYVCDEVDSPTQECFDQHPLTFVEDMIHGAPPQSEYPKRGYMPPGDAPGRENDGDGRQLVRHRYKLPDDVVGDRILLQWQWLSFLGCQLEGSIEYDWPEDWNVGFLGNTCDSYDDQGRLPSSGDSPQHYWQCSEVSIMSASGPVDTPAPVTAAPVTSAPVTSSPVMAAPVTASPITVDPITLAPVTIAPVTTAPVTTAPVTLAPVTDSPITPAPVTSAPITDSPVTASPVVASSGACCTHRFDRCVTWCGDTRDGCLNCSSDEVHWLTQGPPADSGSCLNRWSACLNRNKPCCPGLECVGDQWYKQCKVPEDAPFDVVG